MAHTKAGGSTQYGRDSQSKRLGVKLGDGEYAHPGQIIVRQRGTKIRPGANVRRGADDTLYAALAGIVQFRLARVASVGFRTHRRTLVTVIPAPRA